MHQGPVGMIRSHQGLAVMARLAAIPLEELRYWSVELQEAYLSPEAVLQRLHPERFKSA